MIEPRQIIEEALGSARNPWILSSFGKDSMALIDLCSKYGINQVLYLEDRDEVVDNDHISRTVDRYNLRVMRMHSGRAVLYFVAGDPYLIGFPFAAETMVIPTPTNIDQYVPGESFTCVDDRLRATHGEPIPSGADLLLCGFKLADWESNTCRIAVDKFTPEGKSQYLSRYRYIQEAPPGGVRLCYPLLDWSHAMVWDYLDANGVGVSPLMYEERAKRPHANRVCYRCHDPFGAAMVDCPKTGRKLLNLSHYTREADQMLERLERLGVVSALDRQALEGIPHA